MLFAIDCEVLRDYTTLDAAQKAARDGCNRRSVFSDLLYGGG